MDLPTLVPVEYRGDLVALVSAERVHIVAPWLLVRPAGDPELRFVGFMCACAGEVLRGVVPGPFTSRFAEAWARRALIDDAELAAMGSASDAQAARRLNVPVDQLQAVRRERRGSEIAPTAACCLPGRGSAARADHDR